ncbi:MAG: HAMP domain-containing histidine kinase [Hyphomonadaceae bacterium]|nr:HAMP domain-containing histidine kinase [Hyphomonadaceae bacterium]
MAASSPITSILSYFGPLSRKQIEENNAVLREQQRQLASISALAGAVSIANGTSIFGIVLMSSPSLYAWAWFSAVLVSATFLFITFAQGRGRSLPKHISGRYLQRAEFSALILGALWGSSVFLTSSAGLLASFFVFIVVVGMATGFCALTASAPRIAMRFALPCLLANSTFFLFQDSTISVITSTLVLILVMALMLGGLQSENQLRDNVRSWSEAKDARRNLFDAIESIDDGFAVYDGDGQITMANSKYRQWFPDGVDLEEGSNGRVECVGEGTWVLRSMMPTADGRTVSIHKDVSRLKHREQQLIAARREAEEADAAKARFLSTMSQELRAPLNIINGFSQIMSSESKIVVTASEMRQYSDSILNAGEHLLTVINDIIEFSQVGTDRYIHDPQPHDVRELLSKAVTLSAQFHGVTDLSGIDISVARDVGDIIVDEAAFRRVLMSVISNGIKFGGSPARMVIRAFLRQEEGLIITVRDFGPGIEASDLERVFEPFYQCGEDPGGEFSGTGLGLTLARELVKLHGGSMSLASRPGAGVTASVILPTSAHLPSEVSSTTEAVDPMHAVA